MINVLFYLCYNIRWKLRGDLMAKYTPPFTITNKMLSLVGGIMEKSGNLNNFSNLNKSQY